MIASVDIAPWAAIATAILVLLGAAATLVGAIGTLRFKTFFERLHAPTLGASLGLICILIASMLFFTMTGTRLVVHEIVIGVFLTATAPVTLMLLGRAALYRERMEGNSDVPPITIVARGTPKRPTEEKA